MGVSLMQIDHGENGEQLSLFADKTRDKAQKLDQAMDELRKRYGKNIVNRAANLQSKNEVGKKYQAQMEN